MSTKERVVLIHCYQNAIVATTLRYPDEVTDTSRFAEIKDLPAASEEELALFTADGRSKSQNLASGFTRALKGIFI